MTDRQSPGQTAYAAYGHTTNGLTYDGRSMPTWDQLGDAIRQAWENAAAAVRTGCACCPDPLDHEDHCPVYQDSLTAEEA